MPKKLAPSRMKLALREASRAKPDFKAAYRLLERAYSDGEPLAAYALGTWYLHGRHVERNLPKAMRYLTEAAERGVGPASFDLAVSYESGLGRRKNDARAAEYYVRAALQGDKQAVYEVGRCFYYGIGVERNKQIANVWLDRARELGVNGVQKRDEAVPNARKQRSTAASVGERRARKQR